MENQEMQGLSAPSAADFPKTTADATTLEIAKLGYETAIQLWAAENENRQSEYNAMLVVNSLILAAIGFSYQTTNFYPPVKYLLPIAGIVICLAWYMSGKRTIEKAICWIYCAREIEGKFFNGVFQHLYNGHLFSKGQAVEFFLKDKIRNRRMKFWGRLMKNQLLLNSIIFIFALMYIVVVLEIP
jgi:hypothetical protein